MGEVVTTIDSHLDDSVLSDPPLFPNLVLAADNWNTNAELIADCVLLGYMDMSWRVLDPTYGMGTWWNAGKPFSLITSDSNVKCKSTFHWDFRNIPFPDASFDAITYDPPYVAKGGRTTSGIVAFDKRYGVGGDGPATPRLLQELIDAGLKEQARLVKKNGFVLVKTMNYISSGKMWPGVSKTICAGERNGLQLWDQLEHLGTPGPQPEGRTQRHARRNHSTLLIFKKKGGTIRY